MPRNVRNSWVDIKIDGRLPMTGGPSGEHGAMTCRYSVREKGAVVPSVTVRSFIGPDGLHHLTVIDPSGAMVIYDHVTER